MNKHACQLCGAMEAKHETRPMEYRYKSNVIIVQQPGEYCDACDESVLSPSDLKSTRKELAAFQAQNQGLFKNSSSSISPGCVGSLFVGTRIIFPSNLNSSARNMNSRKPLPRLLVWRQVYALLVSFVY